MNVLWQGHRLWRKVKAGEGGGGTIGAVGCVLTSFANLLRFWGLDPEATPVTVQAKALATSTPTKRAFYRDLVVWDVVGKANGLVVDDVVDARNGVDAMRNAIRAALTSEQPRAVFLWVDKDDSVPDADTRGKHWVPGVALIEGVDGADDEVLYLDSATADDGTLSLRTLTGATSWSGKPKTYAVRAVRVVRPA